MRLPPIGPSIQSAIEARSDSHLPTGANGTATLLHEVETSPARTSLQTPFIFCMFLAIAASEIASSSCGLNMTNSEPASAAGTWPGGM